MGANVLAGVAEVRAFLEANPDIREIDAFVIDINGQALGKRLPVAGAEPLFESGMTLSACAPLLDVRGRGHDPLGIGGSDGDPDAVGRPLSATLYRVPWACAPTAQVLCALGDAVTDQPLWFDPRQILHGVIEQCNALDIRPVVACELEFYLVERGAASSGLRPAAPRRAGTAPGRAMNLSLEAIEDHADLFGQIAAAAQAQGIPLSGTVAEYGTGQYEVNLKHVDDPLLAADHAVLLKRLVRGVARANQMDATFMAKPFADQPGSGLHVHVSLVDDRGANRFAGADGEGLLQHAVAGMQALLFDSVGLFAPSFNSQRRFSGQFVPTSGTWGRNNRSVAFRIPVAESAAMRIEHRVAGADASPHLVMAAILAALLHGVSHELTPTPETPAGSRGERDSRFPVGLLAALERSERSELLGTYLPQKFLRAHAQVKRGEYSALFAAVLPAELEFYA